MVTRFQGYDGFTQEITLEPSPVQLAPHIVGERAYLEGDFPSDLVTPTELLGLSMPSRAELALGGGLPHYEPSRRRGERPLVTGLGTNPSRSDKIIGYRFSPSGPSLRLEAFGSTDGSGFTPYEVVRIALNWDTLRPATILYGANTPDLFGGEHISPEAAAGMITARTRRLIYLASAIDRTPPQPSERSEVRFGDKRLQALYAALGNGSLAELQGQAVP